MCFIANSKTNNDGNNDNYVYIFMNVHNAPLTTFILISVSY